jgi:two-component system cell cycle response regulator DivK
MPKTILIIEDNKLYTRVFREVLQARGYECLVTADGLEMIDFADKNHPDLILMDIQLPGIPGIEVTRRLKATEELLHIPVIAVTAFAMKGDEERIRGSSCDGYLPKPIKILALMEKIEERLK